MLPALDPTQCSAYYEAALHALRFLEHRSPTTRRFGPDADARWAALRGHLETADRIDLLLRDADAQWPASFGARTVFALRAAAEDDPFGSTWTPLDSGDAETLWRKVLAEPAPTTLRDAFTACVAAWSTPLRPFEPGPVASADKLLVAGPGAIVATALAFAPGRDLSFADQVAIIATPHAHRQLAALSGALLNAARAPAIHAEGTTTAPLQGRRVLVSDDADPADAAFARRFAAG